MKTEKAGVEVVLDSFATEHGIWVIKPFSEGVGSSDKPDQVWVVQGVPIGIECKRDMKLSVAKSIPTACQTYELRKLIKQGGAGCAIDIKSVELFKDVMRKLIKLHSVSSLLTHNDYINNFCIENWATEIKQVVI